MANYDGRVCHSFAIACWSRTAILLRALRPWLGGRDLAIVGAEEARSGVRERRVLPELVEDVGQRARPQVGHAESMKEPAAVDRVDRDDVGVLQLR
jgi:hypothetical protein